MDSIELEVINTMDEINAQVSDDLTYPCLLIGGVYSQEEVMFLIKHNVGENKLPLFINMESYIKKIGSFVLSLDNLLMLHSIGNYSLTLFRSEDDAVKLDLTDPLCIQKFCSLK